MKIGERGQVTIPKKLREKYGLQKNVEVEFVQDANGLLLKKRVSGQHPVDRLVGIIEPPFGLSVDEYIEEIRGR